MRVLFFVEPLVMHGRPFHYWAWLGIFAEMRAALRAVGWEARIIVNEALATRALAPLDSGALHAQRGHGLPPEEVVILSQTAIRQLFEAPNVAILERMTRGGDEARAVAYGALIREALGDFEPDVMMSLTPAPQLKRAFPRALMLATETAAYSRAPFPMSIFFDPGGFWADSAPAREAATLRARTSPPDEAALTTTLRRRFRAFFEATTPFAELERELRAQYPRLGFLPLQFGGESGFDLNAPFRNQGEYLFHVLEQLPRDVGLMVVEHPTAHFIGDVIDEETQAFLRERYPHVRFIDFRSADSAGQYLIHHADFVISVSSSLAIQAMLFGRPVVSVGRSHLAEWAEIQGIERLPPTREPIGADATLEPLLAWLVAHYFVPMDLVRDPAWLNAFLRRSVERAKEGRLGLDFFDPVAPPERLAKLLFRELDGPSFSAKLQNGDFRQWSRGDGPFPPGTDAPDGWTLLDHGAVVSLSRGVSADTSAASVVIERAKQGSGPTLFLQRVPSLHRAAGRLARLRFKARSAQPATLLHYLYLQIADGQDCYGSSARPFAIEREWRTFEHVARVPSLGNRKPGAGAHLEVVFALPPELGAATIELSEVSLEAVVT